MRLFLASLFLTLSFIFPATAGQVIDGVSYNFGTEPLPGDQSKCGCNGSALANGAAGTNANGTDAGANDGGKGVRG